MNKSELSERTNDLFLQQKRGLIPDKIQFPLLPSNKYVQQGYLNTCEVVEARDSSLYLIRQVNQGTRADVVAHIRSEYEGTGFLHNPQNGFTMRSMEEQQELSKILQCIRVKTPTIYYAHNGIQIIEFIDNTISLSDLWLQNDPKALEATKNTFQTVINMHNSGVVAGDRWGPNELISPDGSVFLIDFDIAIFGPDKIEFDLANLLYHVSYFVHEGSPDNLPLLKNFYLSLLTNSLLDHVYNKKVLLQYVKGYADFFSSDETKKSKLYFRWSDSQRCINFFNTVFKEIENNTIAKAA